MRRRTSSVGRRRPARILRRPAALVLRRRAVERPRQHAQGALFGLTNPQGNHGEDVKECYYFVDNTPTHSYAKALYKYPQNAFPYEQLVKINGARSRSRTRVRADRHRHLRRGPLLRRQRRVRQSGRRRYLRRDRDRQSRPVDRPASSSADAVVPQHVVVG